jgi:hypothetical protein
LLRTRKREFRIREDKDVSSIGIQEGDGIVVFALVASRDFGDNRSRCCK